MKVVLDTNVLISAAILPGSIPGRIIDAWTAGAFESITSSAILAELSWVLRRPRIVRRHGWDEETIAEYLTSFTTGSQVVEAAESISIVRDPTDNRLLEAAVAGDADYVVSGDADLRAIESFRNIRILTPAQFLAVLQDLDIPL